MHAKTGALGGKQGRALGVTALCLDMSVFFVFFLRPICAGKNDVKLLSFSFSIFHWGRAGTCPLKEWNMPSEMFVRFFTGAYLFV